MELQTKRLDVVVGLAMLAVIGGAIIAVWLWLTRFMIGLTLTEILGSAIIFHLVETQPSISTAVKLPAEWEKGASGYLAFVVPKNVKPDVSGTILYDSQENLINHDQREYSTANELPIEVRAELTQLQPTEGQKVIVLRCDGCAAHQWLGCQLKVRRIPWWKRTNDLDVKGYILNKNWSSYLNTVTENMIR